MTDDRAGDAVVAAAADDTGATRSEPTWQAASMPDSLRGVWLRYRLG